MIFSPFRLPGGLELKNRLVLAPMTTYSSLEDGTISPDELPYLERRAAGGLGMIMTAACYVHPSGHAFDGQWGCEHDGRIPSLKAAADAIHAGGSTAVLQIHHGGRQCPARLAGGAPWCASAVKADRPQADEPREMTLAEVEEMVQCFAQAARRAKEAGFDGVEIHGANTYLLQQFVSPLTNRRSDAYGQDRLRFSREIVEQVLAAVGPNFAVGYRFSPEEIEEGGLRIEHTEELIELLCGYPLAWLHISLRDFRDASLVGAYEEPTLARLWRKIGGRVPFIGVGGILTPEDARLALAHCDLVAIGKVGISEPEWMRKALTGETIRNKIPAVGAREELTLPAGLERKIYAVKGWFTIEPEA